MYIYNWVTLKYIIINICVTCYLSLVKKRFSSIVFCNVIHSYETYIMVVSKKRQFKLNWKWFAITEQKLYVVVHRLKRLFLALFNRKLLARWFKQSHLSCFLWRWYMDFCEGGPLTYLLLSRYLVGILCTFDKIKRKCMHIEAVRKCFSVIVIGRQYNRF